MQTKSELCAVLGYDPETGKFTWKISGKNHNVGDAAGRVNTQGYVIISVAGTPYLAHRLAWLFMTGEFPAGQLDHANMDKADNRWGNLRGATPTLNGINQSRKSTNLAGFKCVSLDAKSSKWRLRMRVGPYLRSFGYYTSKQAAIAAYGELSTIIFGEYARKE